MTALQATSWRLAQPSHVAGAVSQGRSAGSLRLRGPCILSRQVISHRCAVATSCSSIQLRCKTCPCAGQPRLGPGAQTGGMHAPISNGQQASGGEAPLWGTAATTHECQGSLRSTRCCCTTPVACLTCRPALRRSSRAVGPAPPPRAIEEVDLGFSADPEAETYFDDHTGFNLRREGGGYTPFEFITFSDEVLRHEVALRVDAPVSKCFQIWSDRFNWMQWCAEIEEVRWALLCWGCVWAPALRRGAKSGM